MFQNDLSIICSDYSSWNMKLHIYIYMYIFVAVCWTKRWYLVVKPYHGAPENELNVCIVAVFCSSRIISPIHREKSQQPGVSQAKETTTEMRKTALITGITGWLWRLAKENGEVYSFSHNHGSGKIPQMKGTYYWREPFSTSMIVGGSPIEDHFMLLVQKSGVYQLIWRIYLFICRVLYMSCGCLGFLQWILRLIVTGRWASTLPT